MSKTSKKLQKTKKPQVVLIDSTVVSVDSKPAVTSKNTQISQLENILTFSNYGIFLQALVATLGSLYYSTYGDPVANMAAGQFFPSSGGFVPCELCWFARILMYPLVVISGVALVKEDRRFTDYILPMSVVGIVLEFFHYGLQKFSFPNPFRCTATNPCSALQVDYFGFITIPFLCLTAFVIITILAIVHVLVNKKLNALNAKN